MINKIFTFIIILGFGSFLLSGETTRISNKEESKTKKIENKEKGNTNKIKPNRVNTDRNQQIKSLRKGFRLQKIEIEDKYRSKVKDLRLKKEKELETLKRELKNKVSQIRNN